METMPFGRRHAWVVFVSSLGQMIGTGVATLAGVIIPMLNILHHPELSSVMQGIIGAMDLIGIVFGSILFGKLTDKYGYLFFFRFCPLLVLVASAISALIPSTGVLIVCLFFIGLGIGGEYSLDSDYISELMPEKWTALMIGVAKTASAFGNIIVAGVCYLFVEHWQEAAKWPDLMWISAAIAGLMVVCRIWFWQSPRWLEEHGEDAKAQKAVKRFLGDDVYIAQLPPSAPPPSNQENKKNSGGSFFSHNWKEIVLTGIPWACEGLGVYGIGVFLPVLVMSLGIEHENADAPAIMHVASSIEVTFFISCIILPGFLLGLWLINRKCSVCKMQSRGFWACAVSLVILLLASLFSWPKWISIIAFMAFELFLNMGPHLVTYILPPKVYPVSTRGFGTGIAASIGKIGAVAAVFIIPILLHSGGTTLVLIVSAGVMAAGAIVTTMFSGVVKE